MNYKDFKNLLNQYWIKVTYNYVPDYLAMTFYEACNKVKTKIRPEDFIKAFFVYVRKGKGLFIDIKI
ncbi:hypothetical protein J7J62_08975 [bacterium]|nr:hypothetical protein [bacterium]